MVSPRALSLRPVLSRLRSTPRFRARLRVEELEARVALAGLGGALDGDDFAGGDAAGSGPAINLKIVAVHEFGHALGLDHSANPNSIMYPYYNANFNLAAFASDPIVPAFQSLYANVTSSPWRDTLDLTPRDGKVQITYSFVPDGTRLDNGAPSNLFASFNSLFGANNWQSIFSSALDLWSSVSNGKVSFVPHADSGAAFNYAGKAENDTGSGDIRIGAYNFDGAGKTLAHTYFPPPNGGTAAGDSQFDSSENWITTGATTTTTTTPPTPTTGGTSPGAGKVPTRHHHGRNSTADDAADQAFATLLRGTLSLEASSSSGISQLASRSSAAAPTNLPVITASKPPVLATVRGLVANVSDAAEEDTSDAPAQPNGAPRAAPNPATPRRETPPAPAPVDSETTSSSAPVIPAAALLPPENTGDAAVTPSGTDANLEAMPVGDYPVEVGQMLSFAGLAVVLGGAWRIPGEERGSRRRWLLPQ